MFKASQQITRKQLQDYTTQLKESESLIAEALTCSPNESSVVITQNLHYSSNTAPAALLRSVRRVYNSA